MTNDEKAKAYEMALEAARKELGVDRKEWEVVQRVLHNIFPELRESEDERIINSIIAVLENDKKHYLKEIAWLENQKEPKHAPEDLQKSFEDGQTSIVDNPEQYGLCKKTEWSEEDERILKGIIGKIDHDQTYGVSKVEMLSFLKSLRPSWKPSEEQMQSLKSFIDYHRPIRNGSVQNWQEFDNLESLYEQLKKL